MARFEHADVMDNGLAYLKAQCNKIALISGYTVGDSYATVNAAILADAAMTSADIVLGSSGNNRTATVAGKTDPSANAGGGGANSHTALLDTVNSKVLYVTEEDAAQSIIAGNAVAIAGFVITRTQPVAP
jgi:hypothetical protein